MMALSATALAIFVPAAILGAGLVVLELRRMRLTVSPDRVISRREPIPSRGDVTLHRADIVQLYTSSVRPEVDDTPSGFWLMALTREGHRHVVAGSFHTVEQSLFIEQEAERVLGIADARVRGESV